MARSLQAFSTENFIVILEITIILFLIDFDMHRKYFEVNIL